MKVPSGQPESYRDSGDSVSLHTTPGEGDYDDDVPQIAPPAYVDDPEAEASTPFVHHPTQRIEMLNSHTEFLGKPINVVKGVVNYIDPKYNSDPKYLLGEVTGLGNFPPHPMIHIVGTHRETKRRGDKEERKTITDFRITLNMREYLYPTRAGTPPNWRPPLHTVENGELAYRGGFMRSRAPGYKAELEVGDDKPGLMEWCHRFCASGSGIKVFRLTRKVTGFDEDRVKTRLEGIIRSSNYRGHINITFPVAEEFSDFYSDGRINRMRLTTWVCWIFYLTFLWIFTWPFLYFATKRYAVVTAEWPFSKVDASGRKIYASVTEEEWLDRYGPAIRQLACDRFQGDANSEYLTQVLARPQTQIPGEVRSGHAGVDAAVGLLQSGLRGANDINRMFRFGANLPQEGWGYDA